MASSELMECGICKEGFSEKKHRPLLLPCSHSFCKHCVDGLIHYGKRQCPVCRKDFQANTSQDLPMNRALLDLIKYTKDIEARKPELVMPCEGWQAPQKEDKEKLQKTKAEMEKLIQVDETLIKELQNFNKAVKVIVEDNEKLVDDLTEHKLKLQNQMKDLMDMDKKIIKARKEFKKAINFTAAGSIMDAISSIMKDLQGTMQDIKLVTDGNHALLNTINENNKESQRKLKCLQEIQNLLTSLVDDSALGTCEPANGGAVKEVKPQIYLTKEQFGNASGELYIVKSVNGKKKYTRMIKKGSEVFVPSSKDAHIIPEKATFFKSEYFKKLLKEDCPDAYMDLSLNGESLGRIIIVYRNHNQFPDHIINHIKLCAGELGPSFKNSNLFEVKNIGEQDELVVFGDYEKNNGTGGKAVWVTEKHWWNRNKNTNNCVAHTDGLSPFTLNKATASQFCIYTCKETRDCFGEITHGYKNFKKLLEKYDIETLKDIKISDCGLIYTLY